jgi:hypothetical protein
MNEPVPPLSELNYAPWPVTHSTCHTSATRHPSVCLEVWNELDKWKLPWLAVRLLWVLIVDSHMHHYTVTSDMPVIWHGVMLLTGLRYYLCSHTAQLWMSTSFQLMCHCLKYKYSWSSLLCVTHISLYKNPYFVPEKGTMPCSFQFLHNMYIKTFLHIVVTGLQLISSCAWCSTISSSSVHTLQSTHLNPLHDGRP